MNITYTVTKTTNDLNQVLALQQANLYKNVSEEEKNGEGFVTVEHDFSTLKAMNDVCAHTIAKCGDEVAGYALSMHPDFGNTIEVLEPLFTFLNKDTYYNNKKFIVMGQVCVSKNHRKKGVFRGLYEAMKKNVGAEFDYIVTDINAKNKRSLQAHTAIGFTTVDTFELVDGEKWVVVSLKT
ncbi:GNAT family N-acetyltransferase [Cellulophaga baltica]|uniref:GNAT family N-acetyltransferase n=1 Tax=Cellulophaga TaxID=104264 RepID=UPI001C0740C9|nr:MULTISPECIES: GNAT family N-acetyltransferase [Cellulophaga]MBU2995654.1 GNAT family N-acetyltransferase [Cellulophaga baltica]MDO6767048.1 GNAT family N-acetyltransferase [Cellulophaga sp. 1_MG-2023]